MTASTRAQAPGHIPTAAQFMRSVNQQRRAYSAMRSQNPHAPDPDPKPIVMRLVEGGNTYEIPGWIDVRTNTFVPDVASGPRLVSAVRTGPSALNTPSVADRLMTGEYEGSHADKISKSVGALWNALTGG